MLLAAHWEARPGIAFCAIFVLAGLSDGADGFLARKLDVCSTFGAELDGRADTVLRGDSRRKPALVRGELRAWCYPRDGPVHLLQWASRTQNSGRLAATPARAVGV